MGHTTVYVSLALVEEFKRKVSASGLRATDLGDGPGHRVFALEGDLIKRQKLHDEYDVGPVGTKSLHRDEGGNPITVGSVVLVTQTGEIGKVIRIKPGGVCVVEVPSMTGIGTSANSWYDEDLRVKSLPKTSGRRSQSFCECGAAAAPGKDRCSSCAFADGDQWAIEQNEAESHADREVRVKALRQKYGKSVGMVVAGRFLNGDEAKAYLQGVVNRLFDQHPTAADQAVIDRIRSQFGVNIALSGRQVELLPS